jgi:hypothetical protein
VVFGALWVFFEGGAGKVGVLVWCFCGEVVVDCVVDRGWLMVVCAAWKIFQLFEIFLWKFPGIPSGSAWAFVELQFGSPPGGN